MPEYNREELQRLIKKYQDTLMKQYAPAENTQPSEPFPEEPPRTIVDEETDIGTLQVRVSTENQAVPIVGAVVTVTHSGENAPVFNRVMITDESGLTPLIDLPTKDRALSLSPGNAQPFSMYTVDVVANGYYPKRFTDLPIYGGVTAIQSVSMLPLPEGGADDAVLIYPQGAPTIT